MVTEKDFSICLKPSQHVYIEKFLPPARSRYALTQPGLQNKGDRRVGALYDTVRRWAVLPPEGLRQLRGMRLAQRCRRPLLERRQRDHLRLSGAVWPRARLRQVLLVVCG